MLQRDVGTPGICSHVTACLAQLCSHSDLLTLVALSSDCMHELMKNVLDIIIDTPFPVNAARSGANCVAAMAKFPIFRRLFVEIGGVQTLLRLASIFSADGVASVAAFEALGILTCMPSVETFVVSGLVGQADADLLTKKLSELTEDGPPALELSRLSFMRYAELGIMFEEMGDFDRMLGPTEIDTTPLLIKCLDASQRVMIHDGSGCVSACVRAVLRLCEVIFTQSKARSILNVRLDFFDLILKRGMYHISNVECTASALALLQAAFSGLMPLQKAQQMVRSAGLVPFLANATVSFPNNPKVQYNALQICDAVADLDAVSLKALFDADPVSISLQASDNIPGNVAILNRSVLLLKKLIKKDCGRTVKDLLDLNGIQSLVSALQRHSMCVEVSCAITSLLASVVEALTTTSAYLHHPVKGMTKEERMKLLAEQQDWKESVMKVCAPALISLCTHQNDVKSYLEPVLNFTAEVTKLEAICTAVRAMNAELPLLRAIFKHTDHAEIVRPIMTIIANVCSCCTDGYKETLARCGTIAVLSNVVNVHMKDSKVFIIFNDFYLWCCFCSKRCLLLFQVVGSYLAICGLLAGTPDGLKQMLQLSGMSTLLQATLLNSDPKTLLSACNITIKVCSVISSNTFLLH
jgi:hypothetical protein